MEEMKAVELTGKRSMEKRYLSLKELSEYLGVAEQTLYGWCCHRKIPVTKRFRRLKFDKIEIDKWMNEKAIEVID